MAETTIEWADFTFNPWEGCTKVSPACKNCYAETRAKRYGTVEWGPGKPRRRTSPANWQKPLQWNKKAENAKVRPRVFCAAVVVPLLFKQWGEHDAACVRVGKKTAGRILDGVTHDGFPEVCRG